MIILQDIITYKNISYPNELLKQVKIIAEHTKNTWQSNRSLDDIIKDTTIGKIAEYTLKEHISKHSDYAILDYDDFRVDNYEKHALLDCIIFEKQNFIKNSVIKRMPQYGKSEQALYIATQIKKELNLKNKE